MNRGSQDHRRVVEIWGREYGCMLLPIFSLAHPNPLGFSRIVFDWGKGLAHPNADVGVALLGSPSGQYIEKLIYRNGEYTMTNFRTCRSGRVSAMVQRMGKATNSDIAIVNKLLDQEFPKK